MNKFWQALLEKAVQKLLQADWGIIMAEVAALMNADMNNDHKREYVVQTLKRFGYSGATWLLRAGIEIAYGIAKRNKL